MSLNETKGSPLILDHNVDQFDPKVVSTVRYLQKLPSSKSLNTQEDTANKQESTSKITSGKEEKDMDQLLISNKLSEEKKQMKEHKAGYRKYSLKDLSNSLNKMRISINEDNKEETRKVKTKHHSIKELTRVTFAKTNIFRTKSEFHKKLMSETNISKHKLNCLSLLKEDEDLKISFDKIKSMPSHEKFLEENLFNDKIFMYKLESMLKTETNKLKRESFFKTELKKALNITLLDEEYNKKLEDLNINFDQHIERINNYKFIN